MRKFNRAKDKLIKMIPKNLHYLLMRNKNRRLKIIKKRKIVKELCQMISKKLNKVFLRKK